MTDKQSNCPLSEAAFPHKEREECTNGYTDETKVHGEELANGYTDEQGIQYSSDGKRLLAVISDNPSYVVAEGVETICDAAFRWCALEEIVLPETLKTIGNEAFRECRNLVSITLPKSVTTIGKSVFQRCRKLERIVLPELLGELGEHAFDGCDTLQHLSLPQGVVTLPEGLFAHCSRLISVTLPEQLTMIERDAFLWCYNLTKINLPRGLTSIAEGIFCGCAGLNAQGVTSDHPEVHVMKSGVLFQSRWLHSFHDQSRIEIPERVTHIDSDAFSWHSELTRLTFPDSIEEIGERVFRGCSSLRAESVVSHHPEIQIVPFGILFRTELIHGFSETVAAELPESVTTIAPWSFYECQRLRSITLPDSITSIGAFAFAECTQLQSIHLPSSISRISKGLFSGCERLTSIILPNKVTEIGDEAFMHCKRLTRITLPKSVKRLGIDLFEGCNHLSEIIIDEETRHSIERSLPKELHKHVITSKELGQQAGERV